MGIYRWFVSYAGDANNAPNKTPCGAATTAMNAACGNLPTVAYYDGIAAQTFIRSNWTQTIVGSEIVKNIGDYLPNPTNYSQLALLDACGRDVTEADPAQLVTYEITGRPDDPNGVAGTFTGAPSAPACPGPIGDSFVTCKVGGPLSTLNFVTDVQGDYVIKISAAGFQSMNLCIRANSNLPGPPPPDADCDQPGVTPTLATQASASARLGQPIHDSATLAGINPTGTIEFNAYGPNDTACLVSVFADTLIVHGSGTYTSADFTPTQPGTYRWSASYSGDTGNPANAAVSSDCTADHESVDVSRTDTTTALAASVNPSVVGQSVTFTATVNPNSGSDVPTGAVQFKIAGVPVGSPVPVDGAGQATLTTTFNTHGGRTIGADFVGTGGFTNSGATLLQQVVRKSPTSVSVVADPNPATAGHKVTLTATVTCRSARLGHAEQRRALPDQRRPGGRPQTPDRRQGIHHAPLQRPGRVHDHRPLPRWRRLWQGHQPAHNPDDYLAAVTKNGLWLVNRRELTCRAVAVRLACSSISVGDLRPFRAHGDRWTLFMEVANACR